MIFYLLLLLLLLLLFLLLLLLFIYLFCSYRDNMLKPEVLLFLSYENLVSL